MAPSTPENQTAILPPPSTPVLAVAITDISSIAKKNMIDSPADCCNATRIEFNGQWDC